MSALQAWPGDGVTQPTGCQRTSAPATGKKSRTDGALLTGWRVPKLGGIVQTASACVPRVPPARPSRPARRAPCVPSDMRPEPRTVTGGTEGTERTHSASIEGDAGRPHGAIVSSRLAGPAATEVGPEESTLRARLRRRLGWQVYGASQSESAQRIALLSATPREPRCSISALWSFAPLRRTG